VWWGRRSRLRRASRPGLTPRTFHAIADSDGRISAFASFSTIQEALWNECLSVLASKSMKSTMPRVALIVTAVLLLRAQAQPAPSGPEVIVAPRPLNDISMSLEKLYHKVVTYEEPISVWRGELITKGRDPDGPFGLWLREDRRFVVPDGLEPQRTPELNVAVLKSVIEAYNLQNPEGTLFQATSSRLGLHILPLQAHDTDGKLVPATTLLDTRINVPSSKRMPSEHIQALCDAVTAANGEGALRFNYKWFDLVFVPNGLRPPKSAAQLLSPEEKEPYSMVWGASGVSARVALLSLIDLSATKFTWHLLCRPSVKPENRFCVLNMNPM